MIMMLPILFVLLHFVIANFAFLLSAQKKKNNFRLFFFSIVKIDNQQLSAFSTFVLSQR